jgi:isocitrate dehydrogenase kinase/phosphatase
LPIALGSKSNSATGKLGVEVYIFALLCITVFYASSYRMVLNNIPAKFFYFLIYMLSLTSISAVLMGAAQSKRVGMYSLMISLIPLVKSIEDNYKQKKQVRMVIYIILILPTFLFSSSLNMLLTAK